MFTIGQVVFDRRARERALVGYVESVPATADLFGQAVAPYTRYTVAYLRGDICTGHWHNDRREADLEPVAAPAAPAAAVLAA